ncbi:hypothetical protein RMCBS344292_15448 [Rhizopus microsporus]|nr:hypothetical protein RMCBS344292_15448 [Rhizopus microsporus]
MSQKKPRLESQDQDDHFQCPICYEDWKRKGEHRLVSLACGHLFGNSCIRRWAADSRNDSCPICQKTIKTSKIRNVLPIKLVVQDTSQIDKLSKELDSLKSQIKEKQNALELSKLALSLCQRELEKAKKVHIPSQ